MIGKVFVTKEGLDRLITGVSPALYQLAYLDPCLRMSNLVWHFGMIQVDMKGFLQYMYICAIQSFKLHVLFVSLNLQLTWPVQALPKCQSFSCVCRRTQNSVSETVPSLNTSYLDANEGAMNMTRTSSANLLRMRGKATKQFALRPGHLDFGTVPLGQVRHAAASWQHICFCL